MITPGTTGLKTSEDLPEPHRVSTGTLGSPGASPTLPAPTNTSSSSADTVLATAGYDHTIKLWQIHTALCIKTFQHPDSVKIHFNLLTLYSRRLYIEACYL